MTEKEPLQNGMTNHQGDIRGINTPLGESPTRSITAPGAVIDGRRGAGKVDPRLHTYLESASVGIFIADEEGCIHLANKELESMFGYQPGELLGQPIELLLPQRFRQRHIQHRAMYMSKPYLRRMGVNLELLGRRQDGGEIAVEVSLNELKQRAETLVMGFVVDVTKRRELEAKLAHYAEELEARNVELDAFAHTVAHELKTPLSLLMGYSALLLKEPAFSSDTAVLEILEYMHDAGQQMDQIINELLLLASVGHSEVEIARLNMVAIVEEAQKRLAFMSRQYQAEMVLPYTWPVAMGYAPWIVEVWANYLSNAIKYGGHPPRIELGGELDPSGMARFWVRDNGPGLPAPDQISIFSPMSRRSQSRKGGHGLGLSIVRRIIEKSQGEVGVESEEGSGSTFWFSLPAAEE